MLLAAEGLICLVGPRLCPVVCLLWTCFKTRLQRGCHYLKCNTSTQMHRYFSAQQVALCLWMASLAYDHRLLLGKLPQHGAVAEKWHSRLHLLQVPDYHAA